MNAFYNPGIESLCWNNGTLFKGLNKFGISELTDPGKNPAEAKGFKIVEGEIGNIISPGSAL